MLAVAEGGDDSGDDGGSPTTMSHVVVGLMTCRRFHRTRCRAQGETWVRRARRVVFFTDDSDGGAPAELRAPVVAHAFQPSASERVFAGGNWRAVPILRALAEGFFTPQAQLVMGARGEPCPRWIYFADDDAYAFTPALLAALNARNADEPHYLGYAFIAAPHLEGVVPGKRQPLFANGGAGIAVSRGALIAALPLLRACEAQYTWNWPGDVRVAQCLLDAGVAVEWVKTFHAEAPGVIIHKQKPPPGSVPVGLHLPPISFHHVSPDELHALEVRWLRSIEPNEPPAIPQPALSAPQPKRASAQARLSPPQPAPACPSPLQPAQIDHQSAIPVHGLSRR